MLSWTERATLLSTLAVMWTQQRWCLVPGKTSSMAFQKPSAPSPTARSGAISSPRRLISIRSSRQLCALSLTPVWKPTSSFLPSGVAPISTSTALAGLAEGPARDEREIELQLARGLSLFTAKGFQAAEAARAYTRARELAEQRGDPHQLFMAIYGLWQSANGTGRIPDCRSLSNRLQKLTADDADDELRLQAHHSAWATYLFAGEPAVSREHSEAGCRLYDPERHRLHHQHYGGHDPGACARYFGAQIHRVLGYPD